MNFFITSHFVLCNENRNNEEDIIVIAVPTDGWIPR